MKAQTWYLGATQADVARRAILVGDPARVEVFADQMSAVRVINEERELRAITGRFGDQLVTVSAFGIGAPGAAIVLEELIACGAQMVLRAGTAMAVDSIPLGAFVVAHGALRGDSTSAGYAPLGYPALSDFWLTQTVVDTLRGARADYRLGVLASFDGFYADLMARDERRRQRVLDSMEQLRRLGVIAADMETSAVLVAAAQLRARACSLCLVSVDGKTYQRMEGEARFSGERQLARLALLAVCAHLPNREPKTEEGR